MARFARWGTAELQRALYYARRRRRRRLDSSGSSESGSLTISSFQANTTSADIEVTSSTLPTGTFFDVIYAVTNQSTTFANTAALQSAIAAGSSSILTDGLLDGETENLRVGNSAQGLLLDLGEVTGQIRIHVFVSAEGVTSDIATANISFLTNPTLVTSRADYFEGFSGTIQTGNFTVADESNDALVFSIGGTRADNTLTQPNPVVKWGTQTFTPVNEPADTSDQHAVFILLNPDPGTDQVVIENVGSAFRLQTFTTHWRNVAQTDTVGAEVQGDRGSEVTITPQATNSVIIGSVSSATGGIITDPPSVTNMTVIDYSQNPTGGGGRSDGAICYGPPTTIGVDQTLSMGDMSGNASANWCYFEMKGA